MSAKTLSRTEFDAAGGTTQAGANGRTYGLLGNDRGTIDVFVFNDDVAAEIGSSLDEHCAGWIIQGHADGSTEKAISRFWSDFNDKIDAVRPEVRDVLKATGYNPVPTGGGLMGWSKEYDGGHILITFDDEIDGDPATPDWIVGRYGDEGGYVSVSGITLTECVEIGGRLPDPDAGGEPLEDTFDSAAEFEAYLAARDPSP